MVQLDRQPSKVAGVLRRRRRKQSARPKLLDVLISDQLNWLCRSIAVDEQHGFRRGRSTSTNLMVYVTDLLSALERGLQVDVICTDFSRAFDRVNHRLLLAKLEATGFSKMSLKWLGGMLIGRTQKG